MTEEHDSYPKPFQNFNARLSSFLPRKRREGGSVSAQEITEAEELTGLLIEIKVEQEHVYTCLSRPILTMMGTPVCLTPGVPDP